MVLPGSCFVDIDICLVYYLRGFAPNKLLILPTARIQNKCACRLTLMKSSNLTPTQNPPPSMSGLSATFGVGGM